MPWKTWWFGSTLALLLCGVVAVVWLRSGQADDLASVQPLLTAQRYDEAASRLERIVAADPENGAAWLALGGARGILARDDEALAAFARVKSPPELKARALTLAAEVHIKAHRAAEAEAALREAVAADPRHVDAWRRLVYLFELERRIDEAREALGHLHELTGDPRHLITLVGLTLPASDTSDPKPDLTAFLQAAPEDPILQRARGLALLQDGRPSEALPYLMAARTGLGDDPIGRLALSECLLAETQTKAAEEALGPTPERPDHQSRWWFLKGRVADLEGRREDALAHWEKAAVSPSQDREALHQIGQAYHKAGRLEDGRSLLERSEGVRARNVLLIRELDRCLREGKSADSFARVAELCEASGLVDEARAWYRQVVALDPTHGPAQMALARPAPSVWPTPRLERLAGAKAPAVREGHGRAVATAFRFEDVAERVGLAVRYDPGATPNFYLPDTMGGGVGLFDYDGDGWLDVYVVGGGPLPVDPDHPQSPNRLFHNRGDGSFEDETERAGVGGLGYGMGCAVGDFDNDGHDDLFVTGLGRTVLYRNRGDGTFEDVTTRAGVASDRWTTAASFADLDGDGDLDLVVVTYVAVDPRSVPDCRDPTGRRMHCPPGHFPPEFDLLFRNNGDGTFTNVSREAGIEVGGGPGLGLAIADLDDDGRLDLFVANDAAPNFFFRNLGGLKFEEVGVTAGLAYDGSGWATASMGVVAEDLDGDGKIDVFHTNFLNEPNTFHRNLGAGFFDDVSDPSGLGAPSRPVTGFGAGALDVDRDGSLDLFVANGHVDDRPWANHPMAQLPHLYRGLGSGKFALCSPETGAYFAKAAVGRGVAAGDIDNDGRVDLIVVQRDAPLSVLRNVTEGGHWTSFTLKGGRPKTPIGARVAVTAGGRTQVRWLVGGGSYLSANDQRLHFGLGPAARVERVVVRWPSGQERTWEALPADRVLVLDE